MTRLEEYLQALQRFGIAPGLERIRALLSLAGDPHLQFPVVLVGGTNGKGSTCEFLARLLATDGKKTGLYTSPHIYRWNERIRILGSGVGGQGSELFPGSISDEELDALFDEASPHIERVATSPLGQPTEFEVVTFVGLWHFARQAVDVAVVEVGLGGKWDATNVTEPAVSVVTHVELDHCDRLGSTFEAIAADKVQIARAGRTLVTAETKPEVLHVFREYCATIGSGLQLVEHGETSNFQEINLATAEAARRVLCETLGWPASHSALRTSHLNVPARFETVRERPRVLLDGANNPDGARILANELRQLLAESPDSKLILVLGILADKDFAAMIEALAPLAHYVIATQSHSLRAARAAVIANEAQKFCHRVEVVTPVPAAVDRALQLSTESDIICVSGSFFTVAEVERNAFDSLRS